MQLLQYAIYIYLDRCSDKYKHFNKMHTFLMYTWGQGKNTCSNVLYETRVMFKYVKVWFRYDYEYDGALHFSAFIECQAELNSNFTQEIWQIHWWVLMNWMLTALANHFKLIIHKWYLFFIERSSMVSLSLLMFVLINTIIIVRFIRCVYCFETRKFVKICENSFFFFC